MIIPGTFPGVLEYKKLNFDLLVKNKEFGNSIYFRMFQLLSFSVNG